MTIRDDKIYIEASGKIWEETGALEALSIAIYNEQGASDYYTEVMNTIVNERGRNTFKFLADDEKRHRQNLEERFEQESGGKMFIFDPKRAKRVEVNVDDQASAVDAVDLAIEAEKAAYEFYKGAAEKTKDENGRRMFENLAEEEDRHYETLRAEREALLGSPYWFSINEQRSMEE